MISTPRSRSQTRWSSPSTITIRVPFVLKDGQAPGLAGTVATVAPVRTSISRIASTPLVAARRCPSPVKYQVVLTLGPGSVTNLACGTRAPVSVFHSARPPSRVRTSARVPSATTSVISPSGGTNESRREFFVERAVITLPSAAKTRVPSRENATGPGRVIVS